MDKIFLDCGSNLGQAFEEFRQILGTKNIQYFLIEPNQFCYDILVQKYTELNYVKIFNLAASDHNGLTTLFFESQFSEGASIISEHNSALYSSSGCHSTIVKTFDLVEWINTYSSQDYQIFLKLDIESSEYAILEKLIHTQSIFKISKIWCEFHSPYMSNPHKLEYQLREQAILEFIGNNHIPFELWK